MKQFLKLFFIFILLSQFVYAENIKSEYSLYDGDDKAKMYFINGKKSWLPIYVRLSSFDSGADLSLEKDGEKKIDLDFKNTVHGWYVEEIFLTMPGKIVTFIVDFSTGKVYQAPSELSGKIFYVLKLKDKLNISGRDSDINDLELVIVDAAAVKGERIDKFTLLTKNSNKKEVSINVLDTDIMDKIDRMVIKGKLLLNSVANGQIDMVNNLLDSGYDINEVDDETGENSLFKAIKAGDSLIADQLIDRKIDLKHKDKKGRNALHLSSMNGLYDVSLRLLSEGTDINSRDNNGTTPLIYASSSPNYKLCELLIKKGSNVNIKDSKGNFALRAASEAGNTKTVEILLQNGADINMTDKDNATPLIKAANKDNYFISDMFIRLGANVNYSDQYGNTPMYYATLNNYTKIVSLLSNNGADINKANNMGWTPLANAIKNRNEYLINYLVSKGANLYAVNSDGDSIYDIAKQADNNIYELVYGFLKQDAIYSFMLFDYVASDNYEEVEKLLKGGAKVNISDVDTGNTPLFTAVANNFKSLIKLLIDSKADVNRQNKRGTTPMMVAVSSGDEDTVSTLLKAGADPNIQSNTGDTALLWAVKLKRKDIVRVLLLGGADPNLKNYDGVTPLSLAESDNNKDIETLIKSLGGF